MSKFVNYMLNKNTWDVKKVRGQSEATLQTGSQVQPKGLISAKAKKLLYQIFVIP